MSLRHFAFGTLALGLSFVSSNAFGAAWVPPSGATSTYIYAAGGDDNGKFGTPAALASGFVFTPNNFTAFSSGGVTTPGSVTTDRAFVTVASPTGAKTLRTFTLTENGDYAVFNGGGVQVSAGLFVTVLDDIWSGPRTFSTTMATPGLPITTAGSANAVWNGLASITLPANAARVQIVFNDILQTFAAANGTSFVEKKVANLTFNVPEPVSATAVAAGISLLAVRRRKA